MRNLSGIFFRHKNESTGKFENVCFEELPETRQREIVKVNTQEWSENMIVMLANTIREIGDDCDLSKG